LKKEMMMENQLPDPAVPHREAMSWTTDMPPTDMPPTQFPTGASPGTASPETEVPETELPNVEWPPVEVPDARSQQAEMRRARMKRVDDYQARSLSRASPLHACLGSMTSGLLRIALQFDEVIDDAIKSSPRTLDQVKKLTPSVDVHLRVARQIDRFAHLEQAVDKLRAEETGFDPLVRAFSTNPDAFVSE
jgi:hypothetical protein